MHVMIQLIFWKTHWIQLFISRYHDNNEIELDCLHPVFNLTLTISIKFMKRKIIQSDELPAFITKLVSTCYMKTSPSLLISQFMIVINNGFLFHSDLGSFFSSMFSGNNDTIFKH